MNKDFQFLISNINDIIENSVTLNERLQSICEYLRDNVNYYDWVGFYFPDIKKKILTLGPFAGKSTEHVQIPVGKGICGQVAQRKETMIVQDVSKEENYLFCSIDVRSEIVVPLLKDGNFIGELDIDSHSKSPFTVEDREFLEVVGEMISKIL